jgi:tripeptide aminopeptidase
VGKGAKHFDVEAFDARWAYTVDGGGVGELEFENFNAASVTIKIVGNNVHPGTAKGVMVNALSLAARIHAEVPADEAPETTEGYEGFYHLTSMKGSVDRAEMHYIIRDFDRKHFEARKRKMMEIAKKVGKGLHPDCYIELVIEDSYYNMHEQVIAHPHVVDIARQAMVDCDIEPQMKPIRGGTDGAQLSFMGLPCPNLFTGGYNYHGKHEFVTLEGMEKAVQVIVRIAELTAARKGINLLNRPVRPRVGQDAGWRLRLIRPTVQPVSAEPVGPASAAPPGGEHQSGSCLYAGWRLRLIRPTVQPVTAEPVGPASAAPPGKSDKANTEEGTSHV